MPKRNFQLPTPYPFSKRWELTADKKHISITIPMMTYDMTVLSLCYSGNGSEDRSVKLVSSSPSPPKLHRINLFPSTPLIIANVRAAIIIIRVLLHRKLDCKAQTRRWVFTSTWRRGKGSMSSHESPRLPAAGQICDMLPHWILLGWFKRLAGLSWFFLDYTGSRLC